MWKWLNNDQNLDYEFCLTAVSLQMWCGQWSECFKGRMMWYKNCNLGDKSMSHPSKSGTILPSEYFDKWKGFLSAVH